MLLYHWFFSVLC